MADRFFGHYRIEAEAGSGGMGVVYRAEDTRLRRQVAIKLLPKEYLQEPGWLERFQREGRTASALNHPNICTVHDVGEQDGQPFLVMELLIGRTLKDRLASGPLPLQELLEIALQITAGLAAAHQKNIVHRDIKPANIFLVEPGPHVKLLDFGLAKSATDYGAERGSRDSTAPLTEWVSELGSIAGTIAYMSPEQARGESLDGRSDLVSFGAVLHEMATGVAAFTGPTNAVIFDAILNRPPRRPAKLNRLIPAELERIISKALEKDRDLRYQTAADISVDLRRLWRAGNPAIQNHLKPIDETPKHPLSKRRELARAALGLGALAGLGLIAWPAFRRTRDAFSPAPVQKSIAVLPFVDLSPRRDQEYFCDGMTEELISTLSKIDGLRVVARTSVFEFKGKSQDIRRVGSQLNVATVLEGSIRKSGNELRITAQLISTPDGYQSWSQTYDRELTDVFRLQEEISNSIAGALNMNLSASKAAGQARQHTNNVEAYNLYLQGRFHWYNRTEAGFRSAAPYFEQAIKLDPQYARAYGGLADVYVQLDGWEFVRPHESMPKAKQFVDKALSLDPMLAEAHVSLGAIYETYDWDPEAAGRAYARAVKLDSGYITGHWWYASWLAAAGRREESRQHFQSALKLDPLSVPVLIDAATFHDALQEHQTALDLCRRALDIDPTNSFAHRIHANILESVGRRAEALAEIQKAVDLAPDNPAALSHLAEMQTRSGNIAEGTKILDRLHELARTPYVPAFVVARVYYALGDRKRARDWLIAACQERSPRLGWYLIGGGKYLAYNYGSPTDAKFKALVRDVLEAELGRSASPATTGA